MREKLKELSEILKQNTAIKERLEKFTFWCYYTTKEGSNKLVNFQAIFTENDKLELWIKEIIGREPQYSDILEYLGDAYLDFESLNVWVEYNYDITNVPLSPWPLSDQSDSTLDEIISLCKNVWNSSIVKNATQ